MNQKQRDLLCKMLNTEAEKIKKTLHEQFPLLSTRNCQGFSKYSRKHVDTDDLSSVPAKFRNQFKSLSQREEKLSNEHGKLDAEWDQWTEEIEAIREQQADQKRTAKEILEQAVATAVIEIQFTENAEDATRILSSLPGVTELMSTTQ